MRLILASASPRRAELLRAAWFDFETRPVEVDETPFDGEAPAAYVLRLAELKAGADTPDDDAVVLAADTTVVVDGRILGKPGDAAEAREMLVTLSGREHSVLTGVAIRHAGRMLSGVEATRVQFASWSPAELDRYVASGEPGDKAGAYAVQGFASRFVDRIEGSYSNVVGLPLTLVCRLLRELLGSDGLEAVSARPFARY